MFSVNLPGYSPTYQGAWQGSRDAQQQQINTGAGMWQQLMAQQQQLANQNNAGWQQLQSQIMGRLRGSNKANLQDIADKYTGFWGRMNQQMIDRGLGNTTVAQSVQRGVAADQAKETTRSRGAFAQLMAQSLGQVGSQRLGAQMSNNSALANLGLGNINWLTGIGIGYPDRNAYSDQAMGSGYGGGGFSGGLPPPQGMHMFASDALPMGYEAGYAGSGGYGGPAPSPFGSPIVPNYSSGAVKDSTGNMDYSYATSPQNAFVPTAGGSYAARGATGYGGAPVAATGYPADAGGGFWASMASQMGGA